MPENPITTPLPADLPENWLNTQTIAAAGADVGLSPQHGYNYLMQQVNAAQQGVNTLGSAFAGLTPEEIGVTAKRTCRRVVGTSTAGWTKADCDYLCDGVDDQVEIQAAINSLGSEGGEVKLLSGTYFLSESLGFGSSGITLCGNGKESTVLQTASSFPSARAMMVCNFGGTVCDVGIYGGSDAHGIQISSSEFVAISNCKIHTLNTCYAISTQGAVSPSVTHIHGNYIDGGYGIHCAPNSQFVFFQNNIIRSASSMAISAFNTNYSIFANNFIFPKQGSADNRFSPMYFSSCNGLLIQGNFSIPSAYNSAGEVTISSTGDALTLAGGTRMNVIGNTFFSSSWDTTAHSIYLISSRLNLVADNFILNKNYTVQGGSGNTFVNNKYE